MPKVLILDTVFYNRGVVRGLKDADLEVDNTDIVREGVRLTREGDYAFFFSKNDYPVEVGDCFLFRGTVIGHDICKFEKVPTTKFNNVRFFIINICNF